MGLMGRYFYLLFKPVPAKYFVVHLDVAAEVLNLILIGFDTFISSNDWLIDCLVKSLHSVHIVFMYSLLTATIH